METVTLAKGDMHLVFGFMAVTYRTLSM